MMKQYVLPFVLFLLGFVTPIQATAAAIGFLIFVDVVTGVWASLKTKQKVTSDRLGKTVSKSLVYLLALVTAQVAMVHVFGGLIPLVTIVAGFIGSTELLSIYENLSRISGMDFRKLIAEKLRPTQAAKEDRGD